MSRYLSAGIPYLLALFSSLSQLAAQGEAPTVQEAQEAAQARALLDRALDRMAGLSSCRFAAEVDLGPTAEEGNIAVVLSSTLGPPPVGRKLEGSWFDSGLVSFTLDGTEKGVLHQGLAYYRSGARWRPRLATGPAGEPLWWVPDPARLLAELAHEQVQVSIERNEILANRPVRVLRIALDGDRAADLLLSGMAPDPSKVPPPLRSGRMVFQSSSLGGRGLPKELRFVFELWVDASTGLVHRLSIHGSCANTGGMAGGAMVIRMGGQGLPEQEKPAEEPKTREVKLHIGFTDHGAAPAPEVPEAVLRRFGLRQEQPPVQRGV